MLGSKAKVFHRHSVVCMGDLVPADNFYRKVEAKIDLDFVLLRSKAATFGTMESGKQEGKLKIRNLYHK